MREHDIGAALFSFHSGANYAAYEFLGAHPAGDGAVFRVWAPSARAVGVAGDFNGFSPSADPMKKISSGVWEARIGGVRRYDTYKFAVTGQDGALVYKSDPFAFHSSTRPQTGSKFFDLDGAHKWRDAEWLARRASGDVFRRPMNIYEVHAGSWRQYPDGKFFDYEKLAKELVPYVKSMGYTHIELMPVSEYPLDESWGYQTVGFFSPTSRYGTPGQLMEFVDRCHRAGVGVILDWVGAHFPRDADGLYRFDGSWCYEYADDRMRENPDWGTNYFDFGKNEVVSFLVSSADFWISRYHFDGIRADAVSSMLYLDYGRKDGRWVRNPDGTNINRQAVSLLQRLNGHIRGAYPGVVTAAEESTSFPAVTYPPEEGGLGFTFKWNMGWMNDTLRYMQSDPYFRGSNHNLLTFSLMYAFGEKYILPISHDEVVHGKRSLLDKMPGDYSQKFANLRLFLCYMAAHPGKKLLFMGCEYGPFREWDFSSGLEWFMTDYEAHSKTLDFCRALNRFYLSEPALWEDDFSWSGFAWIAADDSHNSVISFRRIARDKRELIAVFNFSALRHVDYRIGVPPCGCVREVFSSDGAGFFGGGFSNGYVNSEKIPMHGFGQSVSLTLPPLSAMFFKPLKSRKRRSADV